MTQDAYRLADDRSAGMRAMGLRSVLIIGLLVGTHLVVGAFLIVNAKSTPFIIPPFEGIWIIHGAFVMTEITLMGIWAGHSKSPLWLRGFSLLLGIGWGILVISAIGSDVSVAIRITVVAFSITAMMVFSRRLFAEITWAQNWRTPHAPLQFSLKSLFLTILFACVLVASGQFTDGMEMVRPILEAAAFVFAFAFIAWLMLWATLSCGPMWTHLMLSACTVPFIGTMPCIYQKEVTAYQLSINVRLAAFTAIATAASLLVVRSCGYRLVSKRTIAELEANSQLTCNLSDALSMDEIGLVQSERKQ